MTTNNTAASLDPIIAPNSLAVKLNLFSTLGKVRPVRPMFTVAEIEKTQEHVCDTATQRYSDTQS